MLASLSQAQVPRDVDFGGSMPESVIIRAFYRFFVIDDEQEWCARIKPMASEHNILGTILIAPEGINGTVAGPADAMESFWCSLTAQPGLANLEYKDTVAQAPPFQRLKVRKKREIVTLRMPEANPACIVGNYVEPEEWNDLIWQEDVVVIDTRNTYEVEAGTFPGALDPRTESFGEFPAWAKAHLDPAVHKRVAMFCTGGIRCEKSTALLLAWGFPEVHHLRGGILRYLREIPADKNLFQGDCFVFDDRRGVDASLLPAPLPSAPEE